MDKLQFTEDDIREQLEALGYSNIPPERLHEFARDLEKLIEHEQSYSNTSSSTADGGDGNGFVRTSARRNPLESNTSDHDYQPNPSTEHHLHYGKENEHHLHYGKEYEHHLHYGKENEHHLHYGKEDEHNLPCGKENEHHLHYGKENKSGTHPPPRDAVVRPKSILKKEPPKRPAIVRKVVRRRNGIAQVFDESITESVTDDMSALNDQFDRLPLNDGNNSDTETDASSIVHQIFPRRPQSSRELYSHRPTGDEEGVYKPHLPRSFIRPSSAQGYPKGYSRKTDPVSRHKMYQNEWHAWKAPGEKNRKDLRWNIRERMMYKDEPLLPKNQPRVYVPNSYQVPTDKKRQALRWAVRTDLAHRQMPQSASAFQF